MIRLKSLIAAAAFAVASSYAVGARAQDADQPPFLDVKRGCAEESLLVAPDCLARAQALGPGAMASPCINGYRFLYRDRRVGVEPAEDAIPIRC